VTIFDAQPRIGGLWPLSSHDGAGLLHPLMIANQSKHTVQFSGLAWEADAPEFPRAWQVGRYLERYRERYLRDVELRLGWKVIEALQTKRDGKGWTVKVTNGNSEETREFDHLLIGTGYFGQPIISPDITQNVSIPVVHSSKYRDLESLLGKRNNGQGGKILIVGGQMSGIEIAGTVATHLSSAIHSPDAGPIKNANRFSIHHIIQRPVWVFPLHTAFQTGWTSPDFGPLDLPSYNLANRPKPLVNTQGHITVEAAKMLNGIYQMVCGTDQEEFHPLLGVKGEITAQQPFLAVSDPYMDFVRSGFISVSRGKLESLVGDKATIQEVNTNGKETGATSEIDDIAAVILATGFDVAPSLSFLPPSVLQTLSHDPSDINNALALAFHGTHHPSVPNLGFVGFYRSPYWGVTEMHARFLAYLWSTEQTHPSPAFQKAMHEDDSIKRTLALRTDPRRSQFPMGDYPWLMQEFATVLGIEISDVLGATPPLPHNNLPLDILTPARYAAVNASKEQEAERRESLKQTHESAMAGLTGGKFVARAVFRSLLGTWKLEREVKSQLPSHPSGHFSGTAMFLLREATWDGRKGAKSGVSKVGYDAEPAAQTSAEDATVANRMAGLSVNAEKEAEPEKSVELEYLYIEEGEFVAAEGGLRFPATRRYIWRYDEKRDVLSQWFVRTDDNKRADYLFHEIEFVVPPAAKGSDVERKLGDRDRECKGWKAKAGHLCVDDYYDVEYDFKFAAINLKEWRIGYTVKGPKKDYRIDGTYTR
jgi:hypothetical protein